MKHSPATFCGFFPQRQRSERAQQAKSHDPLAGPACQGRPHGSCQAPANWVVELGSGRYAAKNDGFPSRWAFTSQLQAWRGDLRRLRGKYARARQLSLIDGGLGSRRAQKQSDEEYHSCVTANNEPRSFSSRFRCVSE